MDSHLVNYLNAVSHDVITDYLRTECLTACCVWELIQHLIHDRPDSFLLLNDGVQDKR